MKAKYSLMCVLGGLLLSAVTALPADAGTRVYVRVGPPAPVVEVRRVAPGPRYVWRDGYHRWNGHAYVWVPGAWAVPPHPHQNWVPGRWVQDRHGWYYVTGHWR